MSSPSCLACPALGRGAAEPVGVGAGGDDVRTVREPVDQRLAQPRVGDDLRPFRERQVGGHDHRRLLRPVGDHLEHQLARRLGDRHVAQLVDADQVEPLPPAKRAAELAGMGRLCQLVDQPGWRREPDVAALSAGGDAQAGCEMGFACASLAEQQDRFGTGQIPALGQRAQLRRRHAGPVELERVERLHPRQARLLQQPRDRPALALLHLGRQQRLEIADMGLPLPGGGLGQAGELAADCRHAQRLAVLSDRLVLQVAHHAVPAHGADNSTSYSAIVGIGRS